MATTLVQSKLPDNGKYPHRGSVDHQNAYMDYLVLGIAVIIPAVLLYYIKKRGREIEKLKKKLKRNDLLVKVNTWLHEADQAIKVQNEADKKAIEDLASMPLEEAKRFFSEHEKEYKNVCSILASGKLPEGLDLLTKKVQERLLFLDIILHERKKIFDKEGDVFYLEHFFLDYLKEYINDSRNFRAKGMKNNEENKKKIETSLSRAKECIQEFYDEVPALEKLRDEYEKKYEWHQKYFFDQMILLKDEAAWLNKQRKVARYLAEYEKEMYTKKIKPEEEKKEEEGSFRSCNFCENSGSE